MIIVDHVLFLSTGAAADVARQLQVSGFTRIVIGGRPMEQSVEPIAKHAVERGLEVLLLTDLSADETSPDGGVLRGALRLRKAGATLTNCGQVQTILGSHKMKTALILVNVDPTDRTAFSHYETLADLESLLAHSKK
jgi:hypothetical protein